MKNCLFANGIRAVTAELKARHQEPVMSAESAGVRDLLESSRHDLFQLRWEIKQGGAVRVRASSKFMPHE